MDVKPGNWESFGRTAAEDHYSPLTQINDGNVKRLGLAWSLNLDVSNSITAPLAIDGVVYLGAGHGVVYAADARTGRQLWRFDAKAPQAAGRKLRVAWGIDPQKRINFRWEERGGPPAAMPARKGFGLRLIEHGLAREISGTVRLSFEPEGLVCEWDMPLP